MVDITVENKLINLFNLQILYSKLDQIKFLRGELPLEVSDLEDDVMGLETRLQIVHNDIDALTTQIIDYKNNVKQSELLIDKYNKQLDNVKNNREFDALTKEVSDQKLDIELLNKKTRDAQFKINELIEVQKSSQLKIEKKKTNLEHKQIELTKITEETAREEVEMLQHITLSSAKLDEQLLTSFNKIRTNFKNGYGVVAVSRNACGGCFNQIPPQRQVEIKQRKKLIVCEYCGRIMIDADLAELQTQKIKIPKN